VQILELNEKSSEYRAESYGVLWQSVARRPQIAGGLEKSQSRAENRKVTLDRGSVSQ
jgi:hypothetical protein